jgi:hypothetical protein
MMIQMSRLTVQYRGQMSPGVRDICPRSATGQTVDTSEELCVDDWCCDSSKLTSGFESAGLASTTR